MAMCYRYVLCCLGGGGKGLGWVVDPAGRIFDGIKKPSLQHTLLVLQGGCFLHVSLPSPTRYDILSYVCVWEICGERLYIMCFYV